MSGGALDGSILPLASMNRDSIGVRSFISKSTPSMSCDSTSKPFCRSVRLRLKARTKQSKIEERDTAVQRFTCRMVYGLMRCM